MGGTSIGMRLARFWFRRMVRQAARRVLSDRTITTGDDIRSRWLRPEINEFVAKTEADVVTLRPMAGLESIPSFGNRLMVEAALYTISADRVLRHEGVEPQRSAEIVSDLGWHIYRRLLSAYSLPFRLITRDPGRRLRWTIRLLLRFPFNAPGAPGYDLKCWKDGGDIHTHFTHCPPQSCARRLARLTDDERVLEAFKKSWCTYDWPGADIIAGAGDRGHYQRSQTLSWGDPVCDMCWTANARGGKAGDGGDAK